MYKNVFKVLKFKMFLFLNYFRIINLYLIYKYESGFGESKEIQNVIDILVCVIVFIFFIRWLRYINIKIFMEFFILNFFYVLMIFYNN